MVDNIFKSVSDEDIKARRAQAEEFYTITINISGLTGGDLMQLQHDLTKDVHNKYGGYLQSVNVSCVLNRVVAQERYPR